MTLVAVVNIVHAHMRLFIFSSMDNSIRPPTRSLTSEGKRLGCHTHSGLLNFRCPGTRRLCRPATSVRRQGAAGAGRSQSAGPAPIWRFSQRRHQRALAAEPDRPGWQKIGTYEYTVNLNDSPTALKTFNDLPIKTVNGTVIYMRDVAYVHNGNPPQTNAVHVNGASAVLLTIVKAGATSTLSGHPQGRSASLKSATLADSASVPDRSCYLAGFSLRPRRAPSRLAAP